MYYNKAEDIIYVSNPTEKLFIEKDFADHIHVKGTTRLDFNRDWVVQSQLIKFENNQSADFWLPISIINNKTIFLLDCRQSLVQKFNINFNILGGANSVTAITIKPNTFFLLLKILLLRENVKFTNLDIDFYLSPFATIEVGKLLHCKLIYFHSQRITL